MGSSFRSRFASTLKINPASGVVNFNSNSNPAVVTIGTLEWANNLNASDAGFPASVDASWDIQLTEPALAGGTIGATLNIANLVGFLGFSSRSSDFTG